MVEERRPDDPELGDGLVRFLAGRPPGPAVLPDRPPGPAVEGAGGLDAGRLMTWRVCPVATLARVTTPSAIKLTPPTTIEPVTDTADPASDPA